MAAVISILSILGLKGWVWPVVVLYCKISVLQCSAYHIAGNFREIFTNFDILGVIHKVFSVKFGGVVSLVQTSKQSVKVFLCKNHIFTNLRKFLPQKFPAVWCPCCLCPLRAYDCLLVSLQGHAVAGYAPLITAYIKVLMSRITFTIKVSTLWMMREKGWLITSSSSCRIQKFQVP